MAGGKSDLSSNMVIDGSQDAVAGAVVITLLHESAQAAIPRYHRLSVLNNRNLLLMVLGAGKSKIKVLAMWVSF